MAPIPHHHKISNLKIHTFMISQFRWVRSPDIASLGPLLGSHKAAGTASTRPGLSSGGLTEEGSTFSLVWLLAEFSSLWL